MNAIEIKGLCKHYPSFTLENLDLVLPGGCIMGLIGENGAGKSTTIKLILNAAARDAGDVKVLGRDIINEERYIREDLGVVLDEIGFHDFMKVKDVDHVMSFIYHRWHSDLFMSYVKRFAIPEDKSFKEYSRGMKMKLGIAIALSHEAKLLIFDEATSGLDPVARDDVLDILCEFTRDEEHSVLLSSHIVSDLEKICDYIAFMHKGKLLLCKEKDRLKEDYALVRCKAGELSVVPDVCVIGKRETPFGVEAIVRKGSYPAEWETGVLDIEQLFIFMAKEES